MLSKSKIKYIRSLHQKKFRQKNSLFIAEGEKIAQEILQQDKFKIHSIYATESWQTANEKLLHQYTDILTLVDEVALQKISTLKTANQVLMLLEQAETKLPSQAELAQSWSLGLEQIRNPGNLGTIMRIADWFGFRHIFCSQDCVEVYNPKVIQSTMGSFLRVQVHYVKFEELMQTYTNLPLYGAVLDGENALQHDYPKGGILCIGNESRGLSEQLQAQLSQRITIPKYGQAESLNAAIATGILCASIRKK